MSQQLPVEWFVQDERVNAAVAWVLTSVLVLIAISGFLNGLFVQLAVAAAAVFVAVVPALASGSWTRTVSWPLLLFASLPLALGTVQPSFLRTVVVGLSVATLSMLIVAALQMVTAVRMTPTFAVYFVALTTTATAGFWAVGSAASARYLGTRFVATNDELMLVFTAAALAGVAGGLLFRWYFRRLLEADEERERQREVVT